MGDGRYRLEKVLGEGAMGSVYMAQDLTLDRPVAIKILKTESWGDEALARLREEAKVLRRLSHPHITGLLDYVEGKETLLVLEYVRGGSLAEYVEQKHPLPFGEIVELATQLCSALSCAHENGIIHRDLKPANILLTDDGLVKLTDFGLALRDDRTAQLTKTGAIQGTPRYMAPEQIMGERPSVETDIYSFGALLHFLITALPPYKANDLPSLLKAHLESPPANARKYRLNCPKGLSAVVIKATAKERSHRYRSIDDVSATLSSCSLTSESSADNTVQAADKLAATQRLGQARDQRKEDATGNSTSSTYVIGVLLFVSLLVFLLSPWWRQRPTASPAELTVSTNSIGVKWNLSSPLPCRGELYIGDKRIGVQENTSPQNKHNFLFRALTSKKQYRLVLVAGDLRETFQVETKEIIFQRSPFVYLHDGNLYVDYSLPGVSPVEIVAGWQGKKTVYAKVLDNEDLRKVIHVGLPTADEQFCHWKLVWQKEAIAEGKVPKSIKLSKRWLQLAKSGRHTARYPVSWQAGKNTFAFVPDERRNELSLFTARGHGVARLWTYRFNSLNKLAQPIFGRDEILVCLGEGQREQKTAKVFIGELSLEKRRSFWGKRFGPSLEQVRPKFLDYEKDDYHFLDGKREYLKELPGLSNVGTTAVLHKNKQIVFVAACKESPITFVCFDLSSRTILWSRPLTLTKLASAPFDNKDLDSLDYSRREQLKIAQVGPMIVSGNRVYTCIEITQTGLPSHYAFTSCSLDNKADPVCLLRYLAVDENNWTLLNGQNELFVISSHDKIFWWSPQWMKERGHSFAASRIGELLGRPWREMVGTVGKVGKKILVLHRANNGERIKNEVWSAVKIKHTLSALWLSDNGEINVQNILYDIHSPVSPDNKKICLGTYQNIAWVQLRERIVIANFDVDKTIDLTESQRQGKSRYGPMTCNARGLLLRNTSSGELGLFPLALTEKVGSSLVPDREIKRAKDPPLRRFITSAFAKM